MKRRQTGGKAKASASRSINASHSQEESIKEPQTKTSQWGLLLPKLLEMVVKKLDFEKDRSSILNMRGVHPHWNEVVNGVLERRRLSALSKWDPFHECCDMETVYQMKYWPLYIPKLEVANQRLGAIGTVEGVALNKSLYLFPKGEKGMPKVKRAKLGEGSLKFGPNLTSLVLHGIKHTPEQLQQLLKEVPQLKTLEIVKTTVMLPDRGQFESKWPLPSLRKLTTLIVGENGAELFDIESNTEYNYRIPLWLTTPHYKGQLTHLEVDNARLVNPWKIKKLEQLKIYGLESLPVEQSVAKSLVRLSLLKVGKQIKFVDFVGFIQQFSQKLEHLHLDVKMDDFKDVLKPKRWGVVRFTLPEFALENQKMFPQLKTFAVPFDALRSCWGAVEYMLEQFPALEELQLISTGKPFRMYDVNRLEAEWKRIWALCSNLKVIYLYENREENSWWKKATKGEVVSNSPI